MHINLSRFISIILKSTIFHKYYKCVFMFSFVILFFCTTNYFFQYFHILIHRFILRNFLQYSYRSIYCNKEIKIMCVLTSHKNATDSNIVKTHIAPSPYKCSTRLPARSIKTALTNVMNVFMAPEPIVA